MRLRVVAPARHAEMPPLARLIHFLLKQTSYFQEKRKCKVTEAPLSTATSILCPSISMYK